MSVQELQVALTGKDVSASSALYSLARAASAAAKSAGDSLDTMNRRIEESSNRTATSVTSGFGSKLSSWAGAGLAGILGGIAASVTSSVTSVVGDAGNAILSQLKSSVIDYNSQLEQATIGFTTMMGSGSKATAFLDQLQQFAKTTPFAFGDLTQYAQQMMAYGISSKNVVPYLTALGDAAAGAGKSSQDLGNAILAFNQISARGKVDLGDLNQLTNNGVPALQILANAYGITTGQMLKFISTGKVQSSQALPALIAGIEHGTKTTAAFGGMMNKQSETFAGAMSNIQDAVDQTASKAFLPFFKVLERGALGLANFAGSKNVQKWATDTSASVQMFANKVGSAFNQIFSDPAVESGLRDLGSTLRKAFAGAGPALDQILPNLVKFGQEALPAILKSVGDVAAKIPTLIAWWVRLSGALADAGPTFANVIGFFSNLGGTLFNVSAAIGNFTLSGVQHFNDFVNGAKNVIGGFVDWLFGAGAAIPTAIANGILGQGNPIAAALSGMVAAASAVVKSQIGALGAAVRSFDGGGEGSFGGGAPVSIAATDAASAARRASAVSSIKVPTFSMPKLSALTSGGGGGGGGSTRSAAKRKSLSDIFADLADYGRSAGKGLQQGLLGSVSDIRAAGNKMRDAVKEAFAAKYLSKATESDLFKQISATTSRLITLAKERETVAKRITAARDTLTNLRKDRTSLIDATKASTIGAGGIMNYGAPGDQIQGLQDLLQDTNRFKSDLQQLTKRGIDSVTFGQLVQGWQDNPKAALNAANNLLSNPTDLGEIIALQKSLASAAGSLGTYEGDRTFNGQIGAASGKLANAKSKDRVLSWEMQKAARNGVNAVAKEAHLHIHINGSYAGTKTDLAKTVTAAIREAEKTGAISKNWNR